MTNDKNVLRVLNGFLELSVSQKLEFKKEVDNLIISGVLTNENSNSTKKIEIRAKLSSNLGPTNDNNCKCCGRG